MEGISLSAYDWLLLLIFLAVAVGGAVYTVQHIGRRVRDVSRALGADTLARGLAEQARRLSETPKSVSAMTGVCLPRIQRDFPEFGWEQFRAMAESLLKEALLAIGSQDMTPLAGASPELRRQVELAIRDDRARGVRRRYEDIRIHRTEIAAYTKEAGSCTITIQMAVGCLRWDERGGEVVSGSRELPVQTKYDMELAYIQDPVRAGTSGGEGVGLSCPNCGAPVTGLGAKRCEYCGTAVTELNLRVWSFQGFREALG